jgi:hypothetical protein
MHLRRMEKHGSLEKPMKARMCQAPCAFDGCQNNARTLNYCNTHYERLRKHGTTEMHTKSLAERFWAFVERRPNDECWAWNGAKCDRQGRGAFQGTTAPRISYMLAFGDPGALFVCHKCDNPRCVNPSHLFLGTQKDNVRDMISKNRGWWQSGAGK